MYTMDLEYYKNMQIYKFKFTKRKLILSMPRFVFKAETQPHCLFVKSFNLYTEGFVRELGRMYVREKGASADRMGEKIMLKGQKISC